MLHKYNTKLNMNARR